MTVVTEDQLVEKLQGLGLSFQEYKHEALMTCADFVSVSPRRMDWSFQPQRVLRRGRFLGRDAHNCLMVLHAPTSLLVPCFLPCCH